MKPFIVFIAIVLVFTFFNVAVSQLARFKQINITLKAIAEEIACGGGLMAGDPSSVSYPNIDIDSAKKYAEFITNQYTTNANTFLGGEIHWDVITDSGNKSIMVTVTYEDPKSCIFKLFGSVTGPISRKATYEWAKENVK